MKKLPSIIRAMTPMDVPAVFQVETVSHPVPWTRQQLFYDCPRVGYYGVVIQVANEIIGYGLSGMEKNECHILNLAVLPEYRALGYGQELVEHLVERARTKQRASKMVLEVRASNMSALKLYEKLGFKQVSIRKDYYSGPEGNENAIVMNLFF